MECFPFLKKYYHGSKFFGCGPPRHFPYYPQFHDQFDLPHLCDQVEVEPIKSPYKTKSRSISSLFLLYYIHDKESQIKLASN